MVIVAATIGPDPKGEKVTAFWRFLEQEEYAVAILEGPREVAWEMLKKKAQKAGLYSTEIEFLTSELGELLVRRRKATFLHRAEIQESEVESWLARAVTAPSLGSIMGKAKAEDYVEYERFEVATGQGNHAMLPFVGAHVWFEGNDQRTVAYRLCGPGRWPLATKDGGVEDIYVVDKAAPTGKVRRIHTRGTMARSRATCRGMGGVVQGDEARGGTEARESWNGPENGARAAQCSSGDGSQGNL